MIVDIAAESAQSTAMGVVSGAVHNVVTQRVSGGGRLAPRVQHEAGSAKAGGKSWNTRLELAVAYLLEDNGEVVFKSGLDSRFTDHETAGFSLGGASFQLSADNDSSVHNAYIGASLRYRLRERLHVEAELEYSHDMGEVSERALSGSALLSYGF